MKKIWNYALMAAMVCGLSLAVTSCKSDDNDDENTDFTEERESTVGETPLEEVQLASIIAKFAGLQDYDLMQTTGWQQKTYEAQLGLVMDESRPTVLSIKADTDKEADKRAFELLDILGINSQNPDGFTFSDASVGTVSYQHGGGDANTVAVINISVKQLPGITQLRMVKDMGDNAGEPNYTVGDIVEKDNHLYICVEQAKTRGDRAVFVTFHDQHKTETSGWWPYDDITYNNKDGMAEYSTLVSWVTNILMNDANYNNVIRILKREGREGNIGHVVPPTQDERMRLVNSMMGDYTDLLENNEFLTYFKWEDLKSTGSRVAPRGMLLSDTFRWERGLHHSYWVPYVRIGLESLYDDQNSKYEGTASQNSNKFHYAVSDKYELQSEVLKDDFLDNSYRVYKLAAFWQHRYYGPNNKNWSMFDFTKDWSQHPDGDISNQYSDRPWTSKNITSRQFEYIDNGRPTILANDVYVKSYTIPGVND